MSNLINLLKQSQLLREKYKPGTKVELIQMNDIQAPRPGTKGIVKYVDDAGSIHVSWENGSSLALIYEEDKFKVIS